MSAAGTGTLGGSPATGPGVRGGGRERRGAAFCRRWLQVGRLVQHHAGHDDDHDRRVDRDHRAAGDLPGIGLDPFAAGNVSYLLWLIMGYLLVQVVLVVSLGRLGGGSGTENSAMPPEETWSAGSSAALIRAVTGRLSARYVPVNVCMPRSLAAWASRRRSSVARPASRQPGVTAMATSAVPSWSAGS